MSKKLFNDDMPSNVGSLIEISEEDIDALSRMAYHEARGIASDTGDWQRAYGSIIDAVLNRVAANKKYLGGRDISSVLNRSTVKKSGKSFTSSAPSTNRPTGHGPV